MPEGGAARSEPGLRLFVALAFPDEVRAELERVAGAMRGFAPRRTRWANVDGAHLTLRFIGAAPPDAAAVLGDAVARAAAGVAPFELHLADAGVFPAHGAPRVLWVGVGGAVGALSGLRQRVEDALAAAGVPNDERGVAPHVTLGRVNERLAKEEADTLRGSVAALDIRRIAFTVEEVGLYHSDLLPTGAAYTRLAAVSLG